MILPHLERARKIAYKFLDESAGRDRAAKAIASQFLLVAEEERERCARVAEGFMLHDTLGDYMFPEPNDSEQTKFVKEIAKRIRQQDPEK